MKSIATVILILGLATLSTVSVLISHGEFGYGWGFLAVILYIFGEY